MPAIPRPRIGKKVFQNECGGISSGKRATWRLIRLAMIPQILADDLPLKDVHHAIPNTTAKTGITHGRTMTRSLDIRGR
jgi:hypothetical protein